MGISQAHHGSWDSVALLATAHWVATESYWDPHKHREGPYLAPQQSAKPDMGLYHGSARLSQLSRQGPGR